MDKRIDRPPEMRGGIREQTQQLWDFLCKSTESINIQLNGIGGNELTDEERTVIRRILKDGGETDPNELVTLKRMIVATAAYAIRSREMAEKEIIMIRKRLDALEEE